MSRTIRSLLLRPVPEEGRLSIERFATDFERSVREQPRIALSATTTHAASFGALPVLGRPATVFARFVSYPLQALRQRDFDLFHIADQSEAHLARFLPRSRTVVTCHDLIPLRPCTAGFRASRLTELGVRLSTLGLKDVACVVCPSESTRRDVIRLRGVPESHIRVIPNGVSSCFQPLSEADRAAAKVALGAPSLPVLLSISTGGAYKNVEGSLRVVAALQAAGRAVKLLRVGRPLTGRQRALAGELGVSESILEAGVLSDGRLVEAYNAADLLLFPSFHEGFGYPPLEAMACGTPVVASDTPALLELLADAALTAPASDVDLLARHVGSILDSPELALSLRQRGLERAANFDLGRMATAYAGVYEDVIENLQRESQLSAVGQAT